MEKNTVQQVTAGKPTIDWAQKLTSRKLILALVGVVVGIALAFGVEGTEVEEMVSRVAGAVTIMGSIVKYIDGEAKVDVARATGKGEDSGNTVSEDTVTGDAVEEGMGETETF